MAVLIRRLPGLAGTNSNEHSEEKSQAFDRESHPCVQGHDATERDCDRQSGDLLLPFSRLCLYGVIAITSSFPHGSECPGYFFAERSFGNDLVQFPYFTQEETN